jgi:hypothetical protein
MTYRDLRARATEGQLVTIPQKNTDDICLSQRGEPNPGRTIANVWFKDLPEAQTNAALLAHCWNHFDAVLRALETAYAVIWAVNATYNEETAPWTHELAMMRDVLTRAKEIK